MQIKPVKYKIKGITKDLSTSAFPNDLAFDAKNIRITSSDGNTLFSVINEKGTKKSEIELKGISLGYCSIDDYLVVFTKGDLDYIYRISKTDSVILYSGNLNFNINNKIECIGFYETEDIQKVYWIDGLNQPRVINIIDKKEYTDNSFDFVQSLNLNELVTINKLNYGGTFSSGIIQYAFTYFSKSGCESNIFYCSVPYYTSNNYIAGAKDSQCNCAFSIEINNIDTTFEYVRIYSIQRNTINAEVNAKKVIDIKISGTKLLFTDNGTTGSNISSTELLFKGGDELVLGCITSKDNTLFGGDIKIKRPILNNTDISAIFNDGAFSEIIKTEDISDNAMYPYTPKSLNNRYKSYFKKGETYRFAIQAQHYTGVWSEPLKVFNNDFEINFEPEIITTENDLSVKYYYPQITIDQITIDKLKELGYKKVRPLFVMPTISDRHILCQGLLNNTIAFTGDRESQTDIFAYPDFRTRSIVYGKDNSFKTIPGCFSTSSDDYSEFDKEDIPWYVNSISDISKLDKTESKQDDRKFIRDYNLLNLYSPDLKYNLSDYVGIIKGSNKLKLKRVIARSGSNYSNKFVVESTNSDNTTNNEYIVQNFNTNRPTADSITYNKFALDGSTSFIAPTFSPKRIHTYSKDFQCLEKYTALFHYYGFYKSINYDISINNPIAISEETDLVTYQTNSSDNGGNIYYSANMNRVYTWPNMFSSLVNSNGSITNWTTDGLSPVEIKYKTDTHCLFSLKDEVDYTPLLPVLSASANNINNVPYINTFYRDKPFKTPEISSDIKYPIYNYIAELWRDVENQYGGNTNEAFLNNKFIQCGESININNSNTMTLDMGDTRLMRFDYFQSYPFTPDDYSKCTCIESFLCETFINIDARYDNNRFNTNVKNFNLTNYGLINNSYSQINNYFEYQALDKDRFSNTYFPSTVIWSKEKNSGELNDTWTNLNMTSSLDLDGSRGKLNKLEVFNNEIIGFQDKGISNILFNSRIQIPTSDGIPIEISNNYKVSGYRYISNMIGSSSKLSINKSKNGLYFLDNINKAFYLYNGQLNDLTASLGFRSWANDNITDNNWKTFVDLKDRNIYFNNSKISLCYSEFSNKFESFFDYNEAEYIFNALDKTLALKSNSKGDTSIYYLNEGDYLNIFDYQRDSYITYLVNPDVDFMKIFNVIEVKGDVFDNGIYKPNESIDYVEAWNEFQKGESELITNKNLIKKYRSWRLNFPRDKGSLDRISNQWVFLKIYFNKGKNNNYKFVLHDIIIYYTV